MFKVGDFVLVARYVDEDWNGYYLGVDDNVGADGVVEDMDDGGCYVQFDDGDDEWWYYPNDVLEKIKFRSGDDVVFNSIPEGWERYDASMDEYLGELGKVWRVEMSEVGPVYYVNFYIDLNIQPNKNWLLPEGSLATFSINENVHVGDEVTLRTTDRMFLYRYIGKEGIITEETDTMVAIYFYDGKGSWWFNRADVDQMVIAPTTQFKPGNLSRLFARDCDV